MSRPIKFRAWFPNPGEMHQWESFKGAIIGKVFNQPDFCVLMQFTGLLDKNGKEVYEGDIGEFMHEGKVIRLPVIFEEGEWRMDDGNWLLHLFNQAKEVEIIGNIYQNPELLK